jgi:pilus assembly protein CpaB
LNARKITLIVAIVLAVGTGALTLRYLSSMNQQAQAQQQAAETRMVVVASRDISVRTKITPDMLTKTTRAANEVDPQTLTDPKQAVGDTALVAIAQGAAITSMKVGQPAEVGITVRLKPGMRAVSIPVDRVKAVSNLVQPGDRVDVMASVNRGAGIPPRTFTIIRGAIVLAINAQLDQTDATPAPSADAGPGTVTLGVTPLQADLLTVADINTTLRLALRSPQEPVHSLPAEKLEFADLGQPGGSAPGRSNVPPPTHPAPAPLANVPVPAFVPAVTVIDGDRTIAGGR